MQMRRYADQNMYMCIYLPSTKPSSNGSEMLGSNSRAAFETHNSHRARNVLLYVLGFVSVHGLGAQGLGRGMFFYGFGAHSRTCLARFGGVVKRLTL